MTPPIVQSAARLLELARANLVEQKWEYGFCDCCAQPQQFEHTADCRFGLSEGVEELATAVIRMEKALRDYMDESECVARDSYREWDAGRGEWLWDEKIWQQSDPEGYTLYDAARSVLTPPSPPPAQTGETK